MSHLIQIVKINNPFYPTRDYDVLRGLGSTVLEVLESTGLGDFQTPTIVTVNNEPVLKAEWGDPLNEGDVVGLVPVVQGSIAAIIIVAIVAISAIAIALSLSVPVPNSPKLAEPDPVYSLRGQTNQTKLGHPIEAGYGQLRVWPSYGAKPYNKYISNESYQYSLFCIGHGEYQVAQVYIEDTPIEDFEDIEFEVYQPGETVTLFRDNIQTSSEVGSQELYGPNEDNYDSWFTAVANDSGTLANMIELDVALPSGLYHQDKKGKLKKVTVTAEFEYIEIDDAGVEIGSWVTLRNWDKRIATATPRRYTLSQAVSPGRYKVRGRRTNDASNSHKNSDTLVWESMRAFLPNVGTYGEVTMLAIKARATANLNDQSKRKINCDVVRMLPNITGGAPTATRSLVRAFLDVFRSTYGANLLTSDLFNLVAMQALDNEFNSEGIFFDWVFDSKTTVWEAAKTVCQAGRAMPILDGSQVYIVRDIPRATVHHLFNDENIIQDSFELNVSLLRVEEYDSIEMEYRDPTTWKPETVICALPGSNVDKPESRNIAGVADRDRAYHEGMYMLGVKKFQRQEVKFSTGVEGFLATYGDFIKVEFDTFGVEDAVGGHITAVSVDRLTVELTVPVTFTEGFDYRLSAKGKDGTIYGPYTATEGLDSYQVVLEAPITTELNFANNSETPIFIFGRSVSFAQDCVITNLSPGGDETVDVTAIIYDDRVYDYDDTDAPALEYSGSQFPSDPLPVVTGVKLEGVSENLFNISWVGADQASSYIVQISGDPDEYEGFPDVENSDPNEAWETIGQTPATSFETTILLEYVYIRVAGVNVGQGPWSYYEQLIDGDVRVTEGTTSEPSLTRVTEDGNNRVTHLEP
tara:strand:- start:18458 stop:21043 length:2586 start_codon:yes stop_codon:yes gene_type:complete